MPLRRINDVVLTYEFSQERGVTATDQISSQALNFNNQKNHILAKNAIRKDEPLLNRLCCRSRVLQGWLHSKKRQKDRVKTPKNLPLRVPNADPE